MMEENLGKLCCIHVEKKDIQREILNNDISGFEKIKCPLNNSYAISSYRIVKRERDLDKVKNDFKAIVCSVEKRAPGILLQCSPSNGCFCFYQDKILKHPSPEHAPEEENQEQLSM